MFEESPEFVSTLSDSTGLFLATLLGILSEILENQK
jgi:hypothetical protein